MRLERAEDADVRTSSREGAIRAPTVRAPLVAAALGVAASGWAIHAEHEARHVALAAANAAAARAAHVHALRGEILRLDELLTSAARLAAATGDGRWRARYATHEPALARAIDEATRVGASFAGVAASTQTDVANRALVAIEAEAFAHVARGELEAASALLDGPRYASLKQTYAEGMSAYLARLDQAVDAAEAEQRRAVETSWPRVLVVVGSLVASWVFAGVAVAQSERARFAAEARLAALRAATREAARSTPDEAGALPEPSAPAEVLPPSEVVAAPLAPPPSLAPETATAVLVEALRARPTPLRVLVVEDNPANRLVATAMLRTFDNLAMTVVDDGHAALEAARQAAFDVVLMDIHMPDLDGLETTRRLRAQGGEAAAAPVIAMTASAFDNDVAACAAAGLEGFLPKPYRRDELAAALLPWVMVADDPPA